MPDKNRYQALLRGKVSSVIEEAKSLSSFSHAGTKGSVLEKLIKNLFLPLLPSDIGVGTGQIIDQHGKNISKQIDIVLYDKSILPPILFDGGVGIFPIESVLYAIEVKTTINNQELITAHDSAGELTNFIYIPGLENEDGTVKHHKIEKLRSVVFALNSNLSESTLSEAKRYEKIYKSKGEKPFIRAICVAGRSYCYDNGENWISFKNNGKYDDVLGFISGIANTYRKVALSRHNPLLGYYSMPKVENIIGPQTDNIIKIEVICSSCGHSVSFKPDLGNQNITVNGKVCPSSPCSQCGGLLQSKEGIYRFSDGLLMEENV